MLKMVVKTHFHHHFLFHSILIKMLKMVVKTHFLRLFLCRSAFSTYLCQRIKNDGSPSR